MFEEQRDFEEFPFLHLIAYNASRFIVPQRCARAQQAKSVESYEMDGSIGSREIAPHAPLIKRTEPRRRICVVTASGFAVFTIGGVAMPEFEGSTKLPTTLAAALPRNMSVKNSMPEGSQEVLETGSIDAVDEAVAARDDGREWM